MVSVSDPSGVGVGPLLPIPVSVLVSVLGGAGVGVGVGVGYAGVGHNTGVRLFHCQVSLSLLPSFYKLGDHSI